jgi:NTE family protein
MSDRARVALVLSGGGARGAYELGVLSVLLPVLERRGERPRILVGASVGAINAAALAATAHLPAERALAVGLARWREVDRAAVIRPLLLRQVPLSAARYIGEILRLPRVRLSSLLDPSPLRRNLRRWIDWPALHRNISERSLEFLAVVATAARSGRSVAFVEGGSEEPMPSSKMIDYVRAVLEQEHVSASAAIPILFPAVRIEKPADARGWYVDGGTRLNTPIKPALDLGAERVVVIGTDSPAASVTEPGRYDAPPPDFGDTALQLLHGALVDPVTEDVRRLGELNAFFADGAQSPGAVRYRKARGKSPYREVPYIFISPRHPGAIGASANQIFRARYGGLKAVGAPDLVALNRLLGEDSPTHGELLSYLLFDPEFSEALIAMGAEDAKDWLRARIESPWQLEPLGALAAPSSAGASDFGNPKYIA